MQDEPTNTKHIKIPTVDFAYQFNMLREKIEKKIYTYLCEISKKCFISKTKIGKLIVYGSFCSSETHVVDGMRRLSNDQIQKYLNIAFPQFKEDVLKLMEEDMDGAMIINQDGQILGSRIYLVVDDPSLDIPEGTGTRHISAASFSVRKDVLATFTLSEETSVVRMWKDGLLCEQYNPEEVIKEEEI
jgi:DNA integrity scanning protein DisA with diadenylate cyclase activity